MNGGACDSCGSAVLQEVGYLMGDATALVCPLCGSVAGKD